MARLLTTPLSLNLLPRLVAAAERDNHPVIQADRVLLRDGEPVGCFGLLPCVFFWSHTANSASETFRFLDEAEAAGGNKFTAPCSPESPLRAFMEKRGYRLLGNADFFLHTTP